MNQTVNRAHATPASMASRFIVKLAAYKRVSGKQSRDLSDRLGLGWKAWAAIEQGMRLPTWEQLCNLSTLANVDPTWWFGTPEPDPDTETLTRMAFYLDRLDAGVRELYEEKRRG